MKPYQDVVEWLQSHPLKPIYVDCATAVMLKILDGKCKMRTEEKQVMRYLYRATQHLSGEILDGSFHQLIAEAEQSADDQLREAIYEKRVLVETMISRPVMKSFKAMIRQQGLIEAPDHRPPGTGYAAA